jgi:hypothetical protein
LAATACNSPRIFIVVAPSGCFERITAEQASGVAASVKIVMWRSASATFAPYRHHR